jgi:prolyl 4-hydroxylase
MTCRNLKERGLLDSRMRQVATEVRGTADTPIYIIDDFLDLDKCRGIIDENADGLVASPLTRYDSEDADFRTSSTAYFSGKPTERLVEQELLDLLKVPAKSAESAQVQRYKVGQHFRPHVDAFHPGLDNDALKQGQRTWTAMVYLNDVEGGGRTIFKDIGESVEPRAGRAVIWSSLKPDGEIDHQTMHEGSDVDAGEKWVITKWMRDRCSQ